MKNVFSMRTLTTIVFAVLTIQMHAKKDPPPASDSFEVNPGQSPNILFDMRFTGMLRQKDDTTWVRSGNPGRSARSFGIHLKATAHSAPLKFDDCVYFSPPTQACVYADGKRSTTPHFFIRRSDHSRTSYVVPGSVRFYLDTSTIETSLNNMLATDTFPQSLAADYLRPFYFRKHEVTNAEYREFVLWVTDSIVRTRLGFLLSNGALDRKKKYDLSNSETAMETDLMLPNEQRFFSRNQVDSRKIIYRFQNRPSEFPFDSLPIYPDTISWMNDFRYTYNEPMTNMYFWHPAYNDYPVVGVSYWQCLAFLEWKSRMLNQQFAKSNKHYKIVCSLPSEIEWDYASTAEANEGEVQLIGRYYFGVGDDSWLTGLLLTRKNPTRINIFDAKDVVAKDTIKHSFLDAGPPIEKVQPIATLDEHFDYPMRKFSLDNEKTWGDFIADGYFHTGIADLSSQKKSTGNERTDAHYDRTTGISWLDGNVSEWLREDLDRNWRGIFLKHCAVPIGPYAKERQQIVDYEKHYYDQLPKQGKLVRGCNWFNERFAMKYGKNVGGMQTKTFCDPKEAHCTLGFRYVIYLYDK